ncbi:hypothetical protein CA13_22110 [Planctomycetes bacterium CA13]|uniref:Uncharacterized protein n=1 Tax=Novipirellula herctigrandis TaxID=2527986 RepID=A0A5C5Z0E1_9BACT|nr:hypothetical protein CA13_22110 [Planctomycetes bacterium CA13]
MFIDAAPCDQRAVDFCGDGKDNVSADADGSLSLANFQCFQCLSRPLSLRNECQGKISLLAESFCGTEGAI